MRYRRSFRVRAPVAAVAGFHAQAASMAAITPPPLVVRDIQAPATLCSDDRMQFTLGFGPFGVRWLAQIEDVSPNGFIDRQVAGPFASWVHRHAFTRVTDEVTQVSDEIHASLRAHPMWGPAGLLMWLGLPLLFRYRGWRTQRLLEALP